MTTVSLISPYAPQPVSGPGSDLAYSATHSALPVKSTSSSNNAGLASDQSGQGTGNGTGTGGAQLGELLRRGRDEISVQRPTPSSVVQAQSDSDPATEFLARKAREQIEAKAVAVDRAEARAEARASADKAEAAKAARPEYVMPNPLPTAPILQKDDA